VARIDVAMPQMGESIAEGTLSKWLKKVGDQVKRDEPMFEISTDKVDAEIPAPSTGILAEILVSEGQTVAVQTVVARLETDVTAPVGASAPVAAVPVASASVTPDAVAAGAGGPPPTRNLRLPRPPRPTNLPRPQPPRRTATAATRLKTGSARSHRRSFGVWRPIRAST
jgi:pyruvate/2-oxoglutarate dehydrogenase complex dihydrolipoamide acyltransferase (E2) component